MKKTLLSIALATISTASLADPFYIDNGTDFTPFDSGQYTATSTGLKNQLTYQYESISTVISPATGITAGSLISTIGGINVGSDANNNVTGFSPNQTGSGANSNNGFGSLFGAGGWGLTFGFSGLTGVIVDPTTLNIAYGPGGLFQLYYLDAVNPTAVAANNFMNINVTGAITTGTGILLKGDVDFTGITASNALKNLFHSGTSNCAGNDSFFAITTNCGTAMSIEFLADFNTNAAQVVQTYNNDGTWTLTGNHDGSAVFNSVPEPEVLALLGGAFLMFGAARRNKKA